MSSELHTLYRDWLQRLADPPPVATRLSCPLLIDTLDRWSGCSRSLLLVGQETKGWELDKDTSTLADLIAQRDVARTAELVSALQAKYREFFYAEGWEQRPFWSLVARLRKRFTPAGVLWTNAFHFDLDRASVPLGATREELGQTYALQRGLLAEELRISKPTHVLFVTGPDYDDALGAQIGGLRFEPVEGFPARGLARVVAPALPQHSYRTYHPTYLRRSGKEAWLQSIESLMS